MTEQEYTDFKDDLKKIIYLKGKITSQKGYITNLHDDGKKK